MDPLSITAATVALIHTSATVGPLSSLLSCRNPLNCQVATSLRRLNQALRTAESRITDLCDELASLTSLLEAVESSLKGYSSLDFASVDEALWRQSEVVLDDCKATLAELGRLVDRINEGAGVDPRSLGWRARVAMALNVNRDDIAALRDKIHKLTSALRTVLHTITV